MLVLGERRAEGNAWSESMRRTDVKHGRFSLAEKATLRAAVEARTAYLARQTESCGDYMSHVVVERQVWKGAAAGRINSLLVI